MSSFKFYINPTSVSALFLIITMVTKP